MNIEKLPSGNYRIRQMKNGHSFSITLDHKPTIYEAEQLIKEKSDTKNITFEKACRNYIDAKSNILSPSTIVAYESIMRNTSRDLLKTKLPNLNNQILQQEVNEYAAHHSAKSTRNFNGFIMSVVNFYALNIKSPYLPPKSPKTVFIPSEEQVKQIYDEIKGTKYEVAIILASMGLRRSEICALTLNDLKGNTLTINKALVQDRNKKWVIKTTKTADSTRTIQVPDYVVNLIREQGYVYEGFPGQIYKTLTDIEKKLDIPHFSLHKMRHFFASYMHQLGYTDKQIQAFGGWKTDGVMKTVYQHEMEMEKAKTSMSNNFSSLIG